MERFKSYEGQKLVYQSYDMLLEMWGVNVEEIDLETVYGRTHIIFSGDKSNSPLVLFHGIGDNSAIMWIYNIKELVKHFYIIAIDTIGGPGKSEPNLNYYKDFNQVKWIDDILNGLQIKKAYFAGVSNGAYITQYYSMKRPERVLKSVCMAVGIFSKNSPNPILKMMKVFLPEALFPTEKNLIKLTKKLCGPNDSVFLNNDRIMKHWLFLLKYFNKKSMIFHKYIKFEDDEIEMIRDNVLFLIGELDKIAYSEKSIKCLHEYRLKYKIVKDAGHGINHEKAELINTEIIEFLS